MQKRGKLGRISEEGDIVTMEHYLNVVICLRARIMTRTHMERIIVEIKEFHESYTYVESWLDDRKWSLTLNGSTTSILVKTSGNWLSVRAHRFCAIVCVSESPTIVFVIRNYHFANAFSLLIHTFGWNLVR